MKLFFACILGAYLFYDPSGAAQRAREAMALWADKVAPSVFPFMVLLPFFTCDEAVRVFDRLFGRVTKKLFRLSGNCAAVVFTGLAAGSPAGAIACRKAYSEGKITPREAVTALTLSSGLSPGFLVFSVGQGMFRDASVGMAIFVCSYLSGAAAAFLIARLPEGKKNVRLPENLKSSDAGAIHSALNAVFSICGWMVVFGVFAGGFPREISVWMEVSEGCADAARRGNAALAAAICCFSGACVLFQNLHVIFGMKLDASVFFMAKCFQTVLGSAMYFLFERLRTRSFVLRADAFEFSCAVSVGMAAVIYILSIIEPRESKDADKTQGN